jgi:SAM-dependent methyltransferase
VCLGKSIAPTGSGEWHLWMESYDAATYGERVADIYDDLYGDRQDTASMVAFLEEKARGGRALELAIGTGRVALPLAARGIRVDGVDVSPAMVSKLRAKPGGEAISVTMGDFADVPVEGRYQLVYLVFNTLFALLTQDDQLRCFENVAGHLTDDGVFVIEAFVPDLRRFERDQHVGATAVRVDQVQLEVSRHDAVAQRVDSSHVIFSGGGVRLYPVAVRYAWPSELDLMARVAGLRLVERWEGWTREPFRGTSDTHVSVYGR